MIVQLSLLEYLEKSKEVLPENVASFKYECIDNPMILSLRVTPAPLGCHV